MYIITFVKTSGTFLVVHLQNYSMYIRNPLIFQYLVDAEKL